MSRISSLSGIYIFRVIYDVILLLVSYFVSFYIAGRFNTQITLNHCAWIAIVTIPIWLFLMASMRMYDKIIYFGLNKVVRVIVVSSITSTIVLVLMSYFVKDIFRARTLVLTYVVISMVLMLGFKLLYKFLSISEKTVINTSARVLIVGNTGSIENFVNCSVNNQADFNIVGFVNICGTCDSSNNEKSIDKYLGKIQELQQLIKENSIDEVIFATPKSYTGEIEKYILQCEEMGITSRIIMEQYALKLSKTYISNFGELTMLTFDTVKFSRFELFVKRLMDIAGALLGIFITGIISIPLILSIKLDSSGPAIFSQNRVGINGRTFLLYKFRTMITNAEELQNMLQSQNEIKGGLMFKMENDPRVTRSGRFLRKTSLDELPQFINILKGEMSLVGTRPPTISEVSNYNYLQRRRISIKPGLTGMWQVSGRSSIKNFDDVVKLDTFYIDNWSLWLDIKIILKTIYVVFCKKNCAF